MLAWNEAWQAVVHHPLFCVALTLGAYQLALRAYERTGWMFLQPVLVSVSMVVGVLLLADIDYAEYWQRTELLTVLLGPATVALAVPLYLNLRRIRQLFWPIIITLGVAGVFTTVLVVLLGWALGGDQQILMTLAPKSVTSPIAILVAEQIGGVPALTAVFVLITGVLGAILGTGFLRRFGIHAPEAHGMALGLTAHAVGTARAFQESDECGAFAALSMSLMGVVTAVLLPLLVALLS